MKLETLLKKSKVTLSELKKFYSDIPEDMWTVKTYLSRDGKCCALGHLGIRNLASGPCWLANSVATTVMAANDYSTLSEINDGRHRRFKILGETPKQRVLAALGKLPNDTVFKKPLDE